MKNFSILTLFFLTISLSVFAGNPPNYKKTTNPFLFNPTQINQSLSALNLLESAVKQGNSVKIDSIIGSSESKISKAELPKQISEIKSPGKIPSFLWSFVLSAAGTYTIWGTAAGPISVLVVYFASGRDRKEVHRSLWGWVTGTVFGLGLWMLVKSLQ
jgi:hypothetical protein